jgi:hypothetical protein
MKYLVTGMIEFYQWVDASSEEEARANIDVNNWRQTQYSTVEETVQDIRVKQAEVETTGEEVK